MGHNIAKERFGGKFDSKKKLVDRFEHELSREAMRMAEVDKGVEIITFNDAHSAGRANGSKRKGTTWL